MSQEKEAQSIETLKAIQHISWRTKSKKLTNNLYSLINRILTVLCNYIIKLYQFPLPDCSFSANNMLATVE